MRGKGKKRIAVKRIERGNEMTPNLWGGDAGKGRSGFARREWEMKSFVCVCGGGAAKENGDGKGDGFRK